MPASASASLHQRQWCWRQLQYEQKQGRDLAGGTLPLTECVQQGVRAPSVQQCVYSVCTVCVQCVYSVCTVCVQCVYSRASGRHHCSAACTHPHCSSTQGQSLPHITLSAPKVSTSSLSALQASG